MKYPLEERLIWFKNDLVPIKEAKAMVMSPTFQFGLNVFEGIPCYWNSEDKQMYAFRLEDHYDRLIRSAALLELECPYTKEQMRHALEQTVSANGFDENITVRQTLFLDDFGSWGSAGPVDMFVVPTPKKFTSSEYNKKGLRVCISSWKRISDDTLSPRIKCGANYINSRMGQREALRNGYDTCLFLNGAGTVSEGPGSCFFMISKGRLITPVLTDSVLESITRDSVITIARDLGMDVVERSIDRTEIYTADEAFLCGSSMELTPVMSVDGHELTDREGTITGMIHRTYLDAACHKDTRYVQWTSPV